MSDASGWAAAEEWAAARPYHLADELSRYQEQLDDLRATRDRLEAKGEAQGVTFTSSLASLDGAIAEAETFIAALRSQAEGECGGQLEGLLASSPARRAEMIRYAMAGDQNHSYQRWLTEHGGPARPVSAEVKGN